MKQAPPHTSFIPTAGTKTAVLGGERSGPPVTPPDFRSSSAPHIFHTSQVPQPGRELLGGGRSGPPAIACHHGGAEEVAGGALRGPARDACRAVPRGPGAGGGT